MSLRAVRVKPSRSRWCPKLSAGVSFTPEGWRDAFSMQTLDHGYSPGTGPMDTVLENVLENYTACVCKLSELRTFFFF